MKGFCLNEVCTTEKGARYLATSKDVYPTMNEMDGWEDIAYKGIQLMPEGYSDDYVVVDENRLFFNGYEVRGYASYVERWGALCNQIPRYYVIRKYNGEYYEFECGLDLLNDGRAWEGLTRSEHDTIAGALRFIREKVGDNFSIWLEEPMQI